MPEGRAERAVEAPAKSMDGAEHSGMLEGVMAGVHIANDNPPQNLGHDQAQDAVRARARSMAEHSSDRRADAVPNCARIASPTRRHAHPSAQASRGVNDPIHSGAGPPCARDAGVVHTTAC